MMGRPPNRKSGAYTAAERQKRYRKRLRAKLREERIAGMQANAKAENRRYSEQRANDPVYQAQMAEFRAKLEAKSNRGLPNPADELARQIAEFLAETPEIRIDDVLRAIKRRFSG